MDTDVFSEGEIEFRKQVEQFVHAIDERPPNERGILFIGGAQAMKEILAAMAPNPPIIPTGAGSGAGSGGSTGSTGSTSTTQGTCPNCNYLFKITK